MTPRIDVLLPTDESEDVVGIVELTVRPEWDGPPLHHHDFDEAFYVLEGELTFQLGNKLRAAGPG
jgi:mannose-6-phosphate isomerase-like protein (cupin superfamily)